jgi:hypothetical protein
MNWSAYVNDSNDGQNASVSCYLKMCPPDDGSVEACVTSTPVASTAGAGGIQQIVGTLEIEDLSEEFMGAAFVHCDVPAIDDSVKSGVVSYRITTVGLY